YACTSDRSFHGLASLAWPGIRTSVGEVSRPRRFPVTFLCGDANGTLTERRGHRLRRAAGLAPVVPDALGPRRADHGAAGVTAGRDPGRQRWRGRVGEAP